LNITTGQKQFTANSSTRRPATSILQRRILAEKSRRMKGLTTRQVTTVAAGESTIKTTDDMDEADPGRPSQIKSRAAPSLDRLANPTGGCLLRLGFAASASLAEDAWTGIRQVCPAGDFRTGNSRRRFRLSFIHLYYTTIGTKIKPLLSVP
jgi:hypothetical protein